MSSVKKRKRFNTNAVKSEPSNTAKRQTRLEYMRAENVPDALGDIMHTRGVRNKSREDRDAELLDTLSSIMDKGVEKEDAMEEEDPGASVQELETKRRTREDQRFVRLLRADDKPGAAPPSAELSRLQRLMHYITRERDVVMNRCASLINLLPIHPTSDTNVNIPGFEHEYFREFLIAPRENVALWGQRSCRYGKRACVCVRWGSFPDNLEISKNKGFVGREFLFADELQAWEERRELPKIRKMCLLCTLAHIKKIYDHYHSLKVQPNMLIQSFYNLNVGKPGQYRASVCLLPAPNNEFTGIQHPVVCFTDNHYLLGETKDGRQCMIERGMQVEPSDFRPAPATGDSTATTQNPVASSD